jgi:hypothetical protein
MFHHFVVMLEVGLVDQLRPAKIDVVIHRLLKKLVYL